MRRILNGFDEYMSHLMNPNIDLCAMEILDDGNFLHESRLLLCAEHEAKCGGKPRPIPVFRNSNPGWYQVDGGASTGNHALQDYEMQFVLLEMKFWKRRMATHWQNATQSSSTDTREGELRKSISCFRCSDIFFGGGAL